MTGLGLGATISPSMAAAFKVLSRAETARGSSALNAIQRIAGAIAAASRHPGAHTAATLAGAFGSTFWVAAALTAAAIIAALFLLLPARR